MEILTIAANEIASGENKDEESAQKPEKKGRMKKRLLAYIVVTSFLCMIIQCLVILLQKLDSETLTSMIEAFLKNSSKYYVENEMNSTSLT